MSAAECHADLRPSAFEGLKLTSELLELRPFCHSTAERKQSKHAAETLTLNLQAFEFTYQDVVNAGSDQLQRVAAQDVLVPGAVGLIGVRLVHSLRHHMKNVSEPALMLQREEPPMNGVQAAKLLCTSAHANIWKMDVID